MPIDLRFVASPLACALALVVAGCGTDPGGPRSAGTTDAGFEDASSPDAAIAPDGGAIFPDAEEPEMLPTQCVRAFLTGVPAVDANGCPPLPATPDLFDEALSHLGFDRCTLVYPPSWRAAFSSLHDDFRLPGIDVIHDRPLLLPGYARNLAADLDLAVASERPVSQAIAAGQARLGQPLDPTVACDPGVDFYSAEDDPAPLAHAIADLFRANGEVPDEAALTQAAATVPIRFQRALVPIIRTLSLAPEVQRTFLGSFASLVPQLRHVNQLVVRAVPIGVDQAEVRAALRELDTWILATYAARLALAVESARLTRFRDLRGFAFSVATPLGRIVLGDGEPNTYSPSDEGLDANVLLLVDTGGSDTYRIPAGANQADQPASLSIDLGGADTYAYDVMVDPNDGARLPSDVDGRYTPVDVPRNDDGPVTLSTTYRQGAGLLGVGMLFDLGDDVDHYRSLRMSQGFGALGVGVLFDQGGDDLYEVEALGQGSSLFGIGLLLDLEGDDIRRTYYASQGFGFVRGFGALVDSRGADRYLADVGDPAYGGDPLYWTPQIPGRGNQSFSQGVGYGRRDDQSGHYMSGGLGILLDDDGDDVYRASVASQASGYWFGTGILIDRKGDDHYDDFYYTQATTAHFAHAILIDEEGDDEYGQEFPPTATGPGVGHDFGLAFMIDLAGNDKVNANVLGLGAGNDNGIGVFVNLGGDDAYSGQNDSLGGRCYGAAMGPDPSLNRQRWPTFGVFIDGGGGVDRYVVRGSTTSLDNSWWLGPTSGATRDHGVGLDGAGSASFP